MQNNIVNIRDISEIGDIAKTRQKFLELEKKKKLTKVEQFDIEWKQAELLRDFRMDHPWKEWLEFVKGTGYSEPTLTRMSVWAREMTYERAKKLFDDGVMPWNQRRIIESPDERKERLVKEVQRSVNALEDADVEEHRSTYTLIAEVMTGHWKQELLGLLYDVTLKKEFTPVERRKFFDKLKFIADSMVKAGRERGTNPLQRSNVGKKR